MGDIDNTVDDIRAPLRCRPTQIYIEMEEKLQRELDRKDITEKLPRKATAVLVSSSYPLDCNGTPPVSVEVGVGASGATISMRED